MIANVVFYIKMTEFHASTIDKLYRVEKCIGRGTFSTVYEIRRSIDNRKFALKKVLIAEITDEKARQDCLNEVKLLQVCTHSDKSIGSCEFCWVYNFYNPVDSHRVWSIRM